MKTINGLTNMELKHIETYGHLGQSTREIAELRFFYNQIEEERKRRNLQLKELQKVIPINKCFRTITNIGTFLFRVCDCKEAPKGGHITHYCNIDGVRIFENFVQLYNNKDNENWQIDDCAEFGWDATNQEMVFWIKGSLGPYEVFEVTEEQNNDFIKTLELLGFDI